MGDTDTDTLSNVISGVYDFDYEEFADVSDSAKDMIRKLLQKNKKYETYHYYIIYLIIVPHKVYTGVTNYKLSCF